MRVSTAALRVLLCLAAAPVVACSPPEADAPEMDRVQGRSWAAPARPPASGRPRSGPWDAPAPWFTRAW